MLGAIFVAPAFPPALLTFFLVNAAQVFRPKAFALTHIPSLLFLPPACIPSPPKDSGTRWIDLFRWPVDALKILLDHDPQSSAAVQFLLVIQSDFSVTPRPGFLHPPPEHLTSVPHSQSASLPAQRRSNSQPIPKNRAPRELNRFRNLPVFVNFVTSSRFSRAEPNLLDRNSSRSPLIRPAIMSHASRGTSHAK